AASPKAKSRSWRPWNRRHGKDRSGTRHRNVGFVYPPRTVGRLQFPPAPLVEFRRVPLHPTPNGRVVGSQTSLAHKLLDIAIREGISQIPTDHTKNDRWLEVSPFKYGWPWFAHSISLSEPRTGFATLPSG